MQLVLGSCWLPAQQRGLVSCVHPLDTQPVGTLGPTCAGEREVVHSSIALTLWYNPFIFPIFLYCVAHVMIIARAVSAQLARPLLGIDFRA